MVARWKVKTSVASHNALVEVLQKRQDFEGALSRAFARVRSANEDLVVDHQHLIAA